MSGDLASQITVHRISKMAGSVTVRLDGVELRMRAVATPSGHVHTFPPTALTTHGREEPAFTLDRRLRERIEREITALWSALPIEPEVRR